jgi:hypothetical protein
MGLGAARLEIFLLFAVPLVATAVVIAMLGLAQAGGAPPETSRRGDR